MTITVNTKAYAKERVVGPDNIEFIGPNHDLSNKDILSFKRVAPKPTSTFGGVSRVTAKFSRTVAVTGQPNTEGVALVEVTTSLPVGMAEVDVDALRDDTGDFLLMSEADDLFLKAKFPA